MFALPIALVVATAVQLVLQPGSRLWVEGHSNVRKWSCEAKQLATAAQATTGDQGAPPAVERLHVSVPVDQLRCGDDHMDDKLREALKSKQYPRIEYAFTSVESLRGAPPGEYRLMATGTLTVAGSSKTVTMVVKAAARPDGTLSARGALGLEMTSYGIDPPSAFLGFLQCKDKIVIRFDLKARAIRSPPRLLGSWRKQH